MCLYTHMHTCSLIRVHVLCTQACITHSHACVCVYRLRWKPFAYMLTTSLPLDITTGLNPFPSVPGTSFQTLTLEYFRHFQPAIKNGGDENSPQFSSVSVPCPSSKVISPGCTLKSSKVFPPRTTRLECLVCGPLISIVKSSPGDSGLLGGGRGGNCFICAMGNQ